MKKILTLIIGLISITTLGQNTEKVNLNWKIAPGDTLSYLTIMEEIDSSMVEFNLEKLLANNDQLEEAQTLLKEINKCFKNIYYHTSLIGGEKYYVVDIVMQIKAEESFDEYNIETLNMVDMKNSLVDDFALRGSVYKTGKIHSFWIEQNQKNIIALFFELPENKVRIGDSWPLEINCISAYAQNFICDSAARVNKVTLIDLKHENDETIAVLKYDIAEFVKGTFNLPSFEETNKPIKTIIKCAFQAIAEFSVEKGQWISYDGIMSIETSGLMNSIEKKKFALIKD